MRRNLKFDSLAHILALGFAAVARGAIFVIGLGAGGINASFILAGNLTATRTALLTVSSTLTSRVYVGFIRPT